MDDGYNALHIAIDNPDSGRQALARMAIHDYMSDVLETEGQVAAARAWKRVQVGCCLCYHSTQRDWPIIRFERDPSGNGWRPAPAESDETTGDPALRAQIVSLLERKSVAGLALHPSVKRKFAGNTVDEWLDPATMSSAEASDLLAAMGSSAGWIRPGSPDGSGWVKEISWGGRMFGAFTDMEVGLIRT